MTTIRPDRSVPGFKVWQDQKAPFRWRVQHRKSKLMVDPTKFPLYTLEFYAECDRIRKLGEAAAARPGTIGKLIERYRHPENPFWADLAPRTKSDYQKVFDYLQPIAATTIDRFTPPFVVKLRDRAATQRGRRFGNYLKQVLSLLFAWGMERGLVKINPAAGMKGIRRKKGAPDANRPWTDAEREHVLADLPPHMLLPLALMMFCGFDPQDAVKLPRTSVRDGMIGTRRGKTGEPVWLPLPEPVSELVARAPTHNAITFCANSRGKPWTTSGLRASWRPIRMRLEREGRISPGLTLKGLRHTVATILAEMGFDDRTIADMLGQRTEAMARHYSKRANRTRKLTPVVKDFEAEVNRRRTENVKPG